MVYKTRETCLLRGTTWNFKGNLCWSLIRPCHGSGGLLARWPGQSRVSLCEICSAQSGTDTGLSPSTWFSPVGIIPQMIHTLLHLQAPLTRRNKTGSARWNVPLKRVRATIFAVKKKGKKGYIFCVCVRSLSCPAYMPCYIVLFASTTFFYFISQTARLSSINYCL